MAIVETKGTDFPLENIPFGVISYPNNPEPRCASAIGHFALDLSQLEKAQLFNGPLLKGKSVFSQKNLNAFMALGRPSWREARSTIQKLLTDTTHKSIVEKALIPLDQVTHHLQVEIGDYTDFYASKEHATNVGAMFRGIENALMPNWVHLPVGYHGRASSVVVSGTPLKRPCGLILNPDKVPYFSPSKKLDYELEVAVIVGTGNALGDRIDITSAEEHIFGMVLMNDWSARDIQQFEYVPLGPFLGKNFGTSISPWIVTLDALEPFRVPQPVQNPTPSEYLVDTSSKADAYDLNLSVYMKPSGQEATKICDSNLKYMYWTFKQQLAHHSVNGCNLRTGDLLGSGTISGPTPDSLGSLLEATRNGANPLTIGSVQRTFIEDGDEIIMKGYCDNGSIRLGFGSVAGKILPSSFSTRTVKQ